MEMRFRKSIDHSSGKAEFRILCANLHLEPDEEKQRLNFGMAPLDACFNESDWLSHLRMPTGITRSFVDLSSAIAFVQIVRDACKATEDYWKAALAFPGDEKYP